jgi:hypothetical protein
MSGGMGSGPRADAAYFPADNRVGASDGATPERPYR